MNSVLERACMNEFEEVSKIRQRAVQNAVLTWPHSKNARVLADFIQYCHEHPSKPFWEALKCWSMVKVREAEVSHGVVHKGSV